MVYQPIALLSSVIGSSCVRFVSLLLLVFSGILTRAQTDTIKHQNLRKGKAFIAPTCLMITGTVAMLDTDADEFFLSNFEIREERNENFMTFSNHADDYLQHLPSAAAFILSLRGIEGKHTLPNQLALYLKSELVMFTIVYPLKYTVSEARPDTGSKNSFPSGHTAQAFTAATFLSKEYGYKSIWISVGAYSVATTVALFRMLNNRHWISDVLVGAGIGILSTELVYKTHQNKWVTKSKPTEISLRPFSSYGSQGVLLTYKF